MDYQKEIQKDPTDDFMGKKVYTPENEGWLITVKEELSYLSMESPNWSICRVPSKLLTMRNDAYNPYHPQIISIGPFHHGRDNLQTMEHHKSQYMLSLLMRTPDANKALDDIGIAIQLLDEEVRSCYTEPIGCSRHGLAKMLLLDACFILELFLRCTMGDSMRQSDPIFTNSWMIPTLQRDLSLLENQIPFFVLEQVFNMTVEVGASDLRDSPPLLYLALNFFKPILKVNKLNASGQPIRHLLDLIHIGFLPFSGGKERTGERPWEFIQCATSLGDAGVQFREHKTENLLDLKFEGGVFEIPRLCILDSTNSLFRNIIAFEQCFDGYGQYMTSYAFLMNHLIGIRSDAKLLEREGVIENNLGDSEDVSALFNDICKQAVLRDFYFAGLCDQVNNYYNRSWHKVKASLKRDYFKNPLTSILLVAAIVLLSLTALQTVFSVLSYFPR